MSTNIQRHDVTPPPPPLDEAYWSSLLDEGEFSEPTQPVESEDSLAIYDNTPFQTNGHLSNGSMADADWTEMQRIMDNDEVIELPVVGYNRGGLLVEWRSLHGFVPASQLTEFPVTANSLVRRKALISWIGNKLLLRVIELNAEQNRLILSERAAHVLPGERADILRRLKSGDRVEGSITNLCDFGAFVDLGGLEGLIHISELSWGRVGHPADILQRGQVVAVYVLEVDREAGRVALSLKRLHPDPWKTVSERYTVGQTVQGLITNVVDFGAFACIEEGLEGLIHVSELAEGHFLHPRNVVNEGQYVEARILSIDSQARRLGLSLRVES
ncbi:MAG TPA: S1 RNA-binding domain-containing protein [Phototrophicaceae bacterium]|nr:S1 RNA-binding domain-containing protein [Phototrophicaceae bacterium]